ncbi:MULTISPECIES: hypothetical protein [Vibrio oreintalis group]|uniref:Uncharacterized protein n=1 Tax=Vibrio brasiliensis LMG 20546 TaxID=945543 RepID=E8LW41_9VIBR|nr:MULTISPECIES: hypothetical protein [Vibrio oreintalis group]EGA65095.1 hypothetical protein VIBR0546_09122 [Vibrio brasiliensis LMG 20546]MCG9584627.1 hypothetical protein [Vibrio tubiashii]MCG9618155.1 hypothetical protein [Vibrio tubiashii]MCG9687420.1 hypothetical protein [Vibrio tubiashii]MDC5837759.1 hypothetical protein [Vibrio europaeus]
MWKIGFNTLIGKGFENMFGITKGQWKVVAVAVVVVFALMYAIHNVSALEDVADQIGLDD